MQIITITGNVGKDPEQRTTQGGDTVTSFSVAVKQGWGDRATTNWFRCSVWGKRGDTIREYMAKGAKATVIGELTIGECQGKPQFDVRVNDVDWSKPAGGERQNDGAGAIRREVNSIDREMREMLSDDVPF